MAFKGIVNSVAITRIIKNARLHSWYTTRDALVKAFVSTIYFSNVYRAERYIERIIYTIGCNTIENGNGILPVHASIAQTRKLLLLHQPSSALQMHPAWWIWRIYDRLITVEITHTTANRLLMMVFMRKRNLMSALRKRDFWMCFNFRLMNRARHMNDSSSQFRSRLQSRTIRLGNISSHTRSAINLSKRIFQNTKYVSNNDKNSPIRAECTT